MKMKLSPRDTLLLVATFLFITSFLLFFVGPELIEARYFKVEKKGEMGDAFGGTLGPIIAWLAALLTFAAFYIQYEANKEQRKQFQKQADDTFIERFENRFFEMIRIHRANVEEQNIQDIITGRKVFTTYYFELRYIYFVLDSMHDRHKPEKKLSTPELTNLAYLIFFFGIGHVTQSVFLHLAPDIEKQLFFQETIKRLKEEKDRYAEVAAQIALYKNTDASQSPIPKHNELIIEHKGNKAIFIQVYQPFTGHGTKIGHYFRHLFQTVAYVDKQKKPLFTRKVKYSYVKTLRAQLSNFEQVIFYYNSISALGEDWMIKGYIQKYKLITNLPLSFADFGKLPADHFSKEIRKKNDFFDWYKLKDAFASKEQITENEVPDERSTLG